MEKHTWAARELFWKIYSIFKDTNNSALKYYIKCYFKSYTGKCNFKVSRIFISAGFKGWRCYHVLSMTVLLFCFVFVFKETLDLSLSPRWKDLSHFWVQTLESSYLPHYPVSPFFSMCLASLPPYSFLPSYPHPHLRVWQV